jgi:aspartate dehydrogenase
MRVGFIGLGTIGRGVLELLRPTDRLDIVGALVAHPNKQRPTSHVRICTRIEDLIALKPDVVVEVAGHAALRCHGPTVLRAGIDLLILAVGALAERDTERAINTAAQAGHSHVIIASGGIGGLDAIASASAGHLTRVTHFTRKPARALLPAEEASRLTEPRELFAGTAREGALLFPENINVAAAVSLAGLGLDHTEVRVVADPALERNRHEVVAEGDFGRLRFEIENVPSADNPRTGRLVAMSVVQALRRRQARLIIG